MKKYPIGIQTFQKVVSDNYYYVDKSQFIKSLVDNGMYYFLSRPRRFGKSLFLSTLKEAFLGNREFFKGLYLEDNWNWDESYPVLHLSWGSGVHKSVEDLNIAFNNFANRICREYSLKLGDAGVSGRFFEIIETLHRKFSKPVVILIDEYDKPILDNIEKTETAIEMREALKNIYSVIKDADEYIKFVFITGVSKFSKVSLFSGLNNLKDITLDKRYTDICGYNQLELESVFAKPLVDVDTQKLKAWYNGYCFNGESVYNPFDVLNFLDTREYRNYWFESATPTFLLKLLEERKYFIPDLQNMEVSDSILGSFDVDAIMLEALLFQTGYLTIKKTDIVGDNILYRLNYPNLEVRKSLNDYILKYLSGDMITSTRNQMSVYRILENKDLEKLKSLFTAFFSSIPNNWYRKNKISHYEGYYASIFYCYFTALGLNVIAEDTTNHGRIDMTVKMNGRIFIFEFKVAELTDTNSALKQIKEKKYHEKYTTESDEIYLIGAVFSSEEKNIVDFGWEMV